MKYLIVTGTSGGHLFPALALGQELKKKQKTQAVSILLGRKTKPGFLKGYEKEFKFYYVNNFPMPTGFSLNALIFPFKLIAAFIVTFFVLIRSRPNCVIGFGSYVSFPAIVLAWFFRIPRVIHEQNVNLGKANRILGLIADKVAVTYSDTLRRIPLGKGVYTGYPLRKHVLESSYVKLTAEKDKFKVIVLGGSQGSSKVNWAFIHALDFLPVSIKERLRVLHVSGYAEYERMKFAYKVNRVSARVLPYIENIADEYRDADLVVSRAGAGAIAEAAAFGVPSVLIPYRYAGAHQLENAKVVAAANGCIVIEENESTAVTLKNTIVRLANDFEMREKLSRGIKGFFEENSSEKLAEEVTAVAGGGN